MNPSFISVSLTLGSRSAFDEPSTDLAVPSIPQRPTSAAAFTSDVPAFPNSPVTRFFAASPVFVVADASESARFLTHADIADCEYTFQLPMMAFIDPAFVRN